jgi:flagellar biosynthesis protein FliQ
MSNLDYDLLKIANDTVKIILLLALPTLFLSLVIGLTISIFQAVTQVQDAALAFVPKIIIISIASVMLLPWMIDKVTVYTNELYDMIKLFGQ